MPRIIKHPELRREELLNHAQALFLTHGYDRASLNDVIAAAGVSKGAFYHYFASKEALLEALAERFARQALAGVQDVLGDPALDPLGRLNALLAKSRQARVETAAEAWALFETMFRPENLVLFHRINLAASAAFSPLLVEIIRQGVADGTFHTFDPEGVADIVMQFGMATHDVVAKAIVGGSDADMDTAIEALEKRVRLYEIALDRILGLPDGSIRIGEPGYVRAVMTARRAGPTAAVPSKIRKRS
ncbi:TetR/AcrR family transcriptional regulator [Mesorhizobium sp. M2D.F.Ca.ET.185.01.1.1]|uniref:TetR/AcrR family transcriptional regulator n=1 Tax=unclassified Mesorhizobium TaxID=325217 RepID=UPI000FCCC580|nr:MULTISPECIES: TetR/AcrR family transcriptional regulator [unclassified Mesorhizobium]TGP79205.1 TetR/AcrR family transcriptional regulator [bacterium M00.F.Ca.ET.227.01.1.1]TGQ01057.1 TetR/AcrR family transcriptional regulator [bacterium M00.F.Ca.ET.221.01.1.1]TGQ02425.1 TetR/AcrR family transcriptional regulator [bacterium M00.F.Ca.ET.222.01.1.1]TGU12321.1 TetR/AcrR family transcriptional regulator [bacterium M00.F.Ca.ET.163.01.1.1]TGU34291.1 TetR/AcrR family transcriptional regulator [bac